jgi:hypothetical protein
LVRLRVPDSGSHQGHPVPQQWFEWEFDTIAFDIEREGRKIRCSPEAAQPLPLKSSAGTLALGRMS